jgi:hypothetical protein
MTNPALSTAPAPMLTEVVTPAGQPRRGQPEPAKLCPVALTLAARRRTQGTFAELASTAQHLRDALFPRFGDRLADLSAEQRIALEGLTLSLAHIANGVHTDPEPWHQIAAAAQAVAERLQEAA